MFVEIQLSTDQKPNRHELKLNHDQVTWELNLQQDLSGFYYSFYVEGQNDPSTTLFNPSVAILDPYAKATVGPKGPGIIIDDTSRSSDRQPLSPTPMAGSKYLRMSYQRSNRSSRYDSQQRL